MANSGNLRYTTEIQIDSDGGPRSSVAQTYTTSRAYDLNAIYQTIVEEGNKQCGW